MQKKLISGTIASAVAMSAAMGVDAAPKPNAALGLDNPLYSPGGFPKCDQVEYGFNNGGFEALWYDSNLVTGTAATKYGGDIEFDAQLSWACTFAGTEAEGDAGVADFGESAEATVDVDLSSDESDAFPYDCAPAPTGPFPNRVSCRAFVEWDDISSAVEDAAEARFGDLAAGCTADAEVCVEWDTPEGQEGACTYTGEGTVQGNFSTFGSTLEGVAFGVKEMNPGHGNGKQNYEKAFAYCTFTPDI